jgi:hypothetical protein
VIIKTNGPQIDVIFSQTFKSFIGDWELQDTDFTEINR